MLIISTISNWLLALLAMLKESANKEKAMSTSGKKVSAEIADQNKQLIPFFEMLDSYLESYGKNIESIGDNLSEIINQVNGDIAGLKNKSYLEQHPLLQGSSCLITKYDLLSHLSERRDYLQWKPKKELSKLSKLPKRSKISELGQLNEIMSFLKKANVSVDINDKANQFIKIWMNEEDGLVELDDYLDDLLQYEDYPLSLEMSKNIKVIKTELESIANERKWVKRLDKSYAGKTRALGCAVALTCFFFSAPINPVFFVGLVIIGLGIIMSYSGWNKTKAEVQKANEELPQIKPLQEKITSIVAKNNTQSTQCSGWFSLFSGRDSGTGTQDDLKNLMKDGQGFLMLFGGN